MPKKNILQNEATGYDPRWFIWTIVFLVVIGVSLTSFIVFSNSEDLTPVPKSRFSNK